MRKKPFRPVQRDFRQLPRGQLPVEKMLHRNIWWRGYWGSTSFAATAKWAAASRATGTRKGEQDT